MKRIVISAAVLVALSAPAFANHCPKDMAAIDAALAKNPQLSQAQLDQVKKLRAQGEADHKAGHPQDPARHVMTPVGAAAPSADPPRSRAAPVAMQFRDRESTTRRSLPAREMRPRTRCRAPHRVERPTHAVVA